MAETLEQFAKRTNSTKPPKQKKGGGKYAKTLTYSPPTPYDGLPASEAFLTECRLVTALAQAGSPLEEALRQSILNVLHGDALKRIDPAAENLAQTSKIGSRKLYLIILLRS